MGGQGITNPPLSTYSHIHNCNPNRSMPIASFHYGPMDRQTNRQTDGASCLSTTKQVTQSHNIVADGWAGAFNRHPHPMPTPTNTRTQNK